MVLFILALFRLHGLVNPWSYLSPELIWPGGELWRLITYPLALSFGGLIVGSIVFGQPGEEIEGMFGRVKFGLVLLFTTIVTALLHLLAFWGGTGPALAGPMNISLFVMVGYVYLFPAGSVTIFFFSVRSKIILIVIVAAVVLISGLAVSGGASPLIFLSEGLSGGLIGILWFHIVYQKYPVLLGPIRRLEGLFGGKEKTSSVRSTRPVSMKPTIRLSRTKKEEKRSKGERLLTDEERLNAILEKIGEQGYESLTPDEQTFLNEYSSRL